MFQNMPIIEIENHILNLMRVSEHVSNLKVQVSLENSVRMHLAIKNLIDKGFISCSADGFSAIITEKGKCHAHQSVTATTSFLPPPQPLSRQNVSRLCAAESTESPTALAFEMSPVHDTPHTAPSTKR